jgi:hypothetical protein
MYIILKNVIGYIVTYKNISTVVCTNQAYY